MADEETPTDDASSESNEDTERGGDVESSSSGSATTVESNSSDSVEDESDSVDSSHSDDSSSPETAEADSVSPGSSEAEPASSELGSTIDSASSELGSDVNSASSELGSDMDQHSSNPTSDVMQGASPAEEAALKRARAVSQLLDEAFRVPGTDYRVGLDPVLGILPVAGDSVATALSFYPIVEAYRLGVPTDKLARMLALVAIDATVGSVPVLGTVFDAFWKANKWNIEILERHVQQG